MDEREWLAERFQEHRRHLHAVAYHMLGSVTEAEDAIQEAWLRIRDQDPGAIDNLQAWLTTVVGRVCLNVLRSRRARREEPPDVHVPDPVVTFDDAPGPERGAIIAPNGRSFAAMGFAISSQRITAIDVLVDPERLNRLDLAMP